MTLLRFSSSDGVGRIVIDRPPANALNKDLIGELAAILDALEADAGVRCLIVSSANKRFFMAGGDINGYAVVEPDALVALVATYRATFQRLRDLPVPVVVAVDGHAQGGGAELLTACDLRIFGPGAKLGFPEVLLGGVPSAGGTQWLPKLLRYDQALELMLTGRTVGAEEAMTLGLGTRLVADPLAEAERIAAEIAGLPPLAIRQIKSCARATVGDDPAAGTVREDAATAAIAVTDEFHERVQAFVTRRAARA